MIIMGKFIHTTITLPLLIFTVLVIPSHCCYTCTPTPSPPPPPKPTPCPPPPSPSPPPPSPPPPSPPPPSPPPPSPPPPPKVYPYPSPPPKAVPCPPPPSPPPPSTGVPCPPPTGTCPVDALKLSTCVDVLGGLVHVIIGQSAKEACCPVLAGVADLDAALCLCTAIRAKALDVNVVLQVALQVLVNDCGKNVPYSYRCPAY